MKCLVYHRLDILSSLFKGQFYFLLMNGFEDLLTFAGEHSLLKIQIKATPVLHVNFVSD